MHTDSTLTRIEAMLLPNLAGHIINHAKITPVDQLLTADMIGQLNEETFWIHTLQSLEPHGINVNDQATFPITQIHKHPYFLRAL